MGIRYWSSDVCSSDLEVPERVGAVSPRPDSCQPRTRETAPYQGLARVFASRDRLEACYGNAMIRRAATRLPAILPLLLAACSNAGGYPSLALRDYEQVSGRVCGTAKPAAAAPEPEAPTLPPASADLRSRLAGLVSAAPEAHQQLKAQKGTAEGARKSGG